MDIQFLLSHLPFLDDGQSRSRVHATLENPVALFLVRQSVCSSLTESEINASFPPHGWPKLHPLLNM